MLPPIFLPFRLLCRADFFACDQRNQRAIDGTGENLGRVAAHDGLNHSIDGGAVVDIAAHEGGIDRLGRHENGFQVDALLAVEAFMIGEMKRQKADVVGLDAEADFFRSALCAEIARSDGERENYPQNGGNTHCSCPGELCRSHSA